MAPTERTHRNATQVTSLDVIENFFGTTPDKAAIDRMSLNDLDELQQLIRVCADASLAQPSPPDTYYPGGFLAGHWQHQIFSSDLHLALLYYPRLLVHDPIADFFFDRFSAIPRIHGLTGTGGIRIDSGPAIWGRHNNYSSMRDDISSIQAFLKQTIAYLSILQPLISENILVLRSQWPTIVKRKAQLLTSTRHDVRRADMQAVVDRTRERNNPDDLLPVWDNLWGLNATPSGLIPEDRPWVNQNEFFYLAKTLAIADQAGATFVPPHEAELELLRVKAQQTVERLPASAQPLSILREVGRTLLPNLELSARAAVDIRKSETDFADWRSTLRRLARDGQSDDLDQLRERVQDELMPVVHRVEKAVSRSTSLTSALREQSATTIISGGAAAAGVAISGGNPLISASGALGGGVLLWLWKAYRPPKLGGVDAVVASLIRPAKREK